MAYITTERVKEIRNEIKSLFPKTFKFSITRENHSCVSVALIASPLKFKEARPNINEFYLSKAPHATILRIIKDVINQGNFDHSDSQTDYFHVGFYIDIQIGRWDKPYVCTA